MGTTFFFNIQDGREATPLTNQPVFLTDCSPEQLMHVLYGYIYEYMQPPFCITQLTSRSMVRWMFTLLKL